MAIVLIGGLITSTIIIRIVLPATYKLVQKFIEDRSITSNEKSSDSLMFKYRGLVGVVCLFPLGIAVVLSAPLIAENTLTDFITDILGWFCFGLYVTFRIWPTLYVGGRKDKELQTQGPYSITRNPLYSGAFLLLLIAVN